MQTFNYLIRRFMATPQAWRAQAIVGHLHRLKQEGGDEEICVDRLLLIWEVIAENLMRHTQQSAATEAALPVPLEFDHSVHSRSDLYEA